MNEHYMASLQIFWNHELNYKNVHKIRSLYKVVCVQSLPTEDTSYKGIFQKNKMWAYVKI